MGRAPLAPAMALPNSVLPTPAGPSTSTGFSSRSARKTTPEIPESARESASPSLLVTSSTDSKRAAIGVSTYSLLVPHLTVAPHDVLVGGELAQRHGAACMQLLRGDPDLGAEAELGAVGEPGGRVHDDGAVVARVGEPLRRREIAGEDRLGVTRPEPVDVVDGRVDRRHD